MSKKEKITVQGMEITVISEKNNDYISLTDMAHSQMEEHIIIKWLSLKSTIEYIGEWETLYNPNFNCTEFGIIKNTAGSNNFVLSAKNWVERTRAIGITAKLRHAGTVSRAVEHGKYQRFADPAGLAAGRTPCAAQRHGDCANALAGRKP